MQKALVFLWLMVSSMLTIGGSPFPRTQDSLKGPVITGQPKCATVLANEEAWFAVTATSDLPITYQWFRNDTLLLNETNAALHASPLNVAANYFVLVSDANGSVQSDTVHGSVVDELPPPAIGGLVGWWRAEGNARDQVSRNLGVANDVEFTVGAIGSAFKFNGLDSYIELGADPALSFGQNKPFSISLWIKQDLPLNAIATVVGRYNSDVEAEWAIKMDWHGNVYFQRDIFGSLISPSRPLITPGVFHHVAASYDGAVMQIYVDGVLQASQASFKSPSAPNTSVTIGASFVNGNLGLFFKGALDDIAIFNRPIQAWEVADIYAGGMQDPCAPASLFFIKQPADQEVRVGEGFRLEAAAKGVGGINYQWQLDGSDLNGETNSALVRSIASAADAGVYRLKITAGAETKLSGPAKISVVNCSEIPDSMVGWWRGEGNAYDALSEHPGRIEGTMTYVAGRAGRAFSPQGGVVRIDDSASLRPTNFTIAAWARSPDGPADRFLISKSYDFAESSWGFKSTDGSIEFVPFGMRSQGIIWNGQWRHLVGTFDGANARLYVDGVLASSRSADPVLYDTVFLNGDLLIGGFDPETPESFWAGEIDEVMVFNSALEPAQIAQLYATGKASLCAIPVITELSTDQSVLYGSGTLMHVGAISDLPMTYQWQRNGTNLSGANSADLALPFATFADAGSYQVTVSDANGIVTSEAIQLRVVPPCEAQPAGLFAKWRGENSPEDMLAGLNGAINGGVLFTNAQVHRGFLLNGADSWVQVPATPALNALASFTIEGWIRPQKDGWVISRYGYGSTNPSGQGDLELVVHERFVELYLRNDDEPGEVLSLFLPNSAFDGSFHHIAAGRDEAGHKIFIAFDDQYKETLSTRRGTLFQPGDETPLFIGTTDWPDGIGLQNATFAGVIDELALYSRALSVAELRTIREAGARGVCPDFQITRQPLARTVAIGESLKFSVEANSRLPLSYHWEFNGSPLALETNATLSIAAATLTNIGGYRVVVSDLFGSLPSAEAGLDVRACVNHPPGLIGWWRGQNGLFNEAGDTRGSFLGGVTLGAGEAGTGYNFDGIDGRISLGAEAGNLDLLDTFTICFWVRGDFLRPETLFSKTADGVAGNFFHLNSAPDRLLRYTVGGSNSVTVTSLRPISAGQWHLVSLIRRPEQLEIYTDGVFNGSDGGSISVAPNSAPLVLGAANVNGDQPFAGAMDEFMIYNRALTIAEISALFQMEGIVCRSAGATAVDVPVGDATAVSGGAWTLTAVTDGFGPFQYQWLRNGAPIPGETGSKLVIHSVSASDTADYSVIVKSPYGVRTSVSTRLKVIVAPTTIVLPAAPILRAGAGESLRLSATTFGDGPFTYQWMHDNAAIVGATNFDYVVDAPIKYDAGTYRVHVLGAGGETTSDPVTVAILEPPRITRSPESVSAPLGSSGISLSAAADGAGSLGFQWRLNGRTIPDATNDTLTIASLRLADAGLYTVTVTSPGGAATSDGAEVTATDLAAVIAEDNFADAMELQTSGALVANNRFATQEQDEPLHANTLGGHSIWFKWTAPADGRLRISTEGSSFDTTLAVYRGNSFAEFGGSIAANDDVPGLATSAVQLNVTNQVVYFLAVDGVGDSSGTVVLSWDFQDGLQAPFALQQPISVLTNRHARVALSVDAQFVETYQWRMNGVPIAGANASNLDIADLDSAQVGAYDVMMSGGGLTFYSDPARVEIGNLLTFDKLFGDSNFTVTRLSTDASLAHEDSTIACAVEADEPNHGSVAGGASLWFVISPDTDGSVVVSTEGSDFDTVLAVYTAQEPQRFSDLILVTADNDTGPNRTSRVCFSGKKGTNYFCAIDGVNGARGLAHISARLQLPPLIIEDPVSQTVPAGATVIFHARAENATDSEAQWFHNDSPLPARFGATLALTNVSAGDVGRYSVVAQTVAGRAVSRQALLSVIPADPIQITDLRMSAGHIRFRIRGGSAQPLRLQSSADLRTWTDTPLPARVGGVIDFDAVASGKTLFYRATQ